ncbi:MAG TPA: Ig-like domain-containing protein, partial [Gemmatimonadales bacterium]|nr:Ig-like domain-containing protein [Gemmatimonadales bacterium]
IARFIVATAALVLLAACNEESGPNVSGIDPISISSIELSPARDTIFVADSIQPGDTLRLVATVIAHSGQVLHPDLAWESGNSAVAVVESSGLVRAVGFGETTVSASVGKKATARVVVARRARGITVHSALEGWLPPIMYVDDPIGTTYTVPLLAQAVDANGAIVPGIAWNWESTVPEAASVSESGIVTAIALGSTAIRASTTGLAGEPLFGEQTIEVRPLVQHVVLAPVPARLVVGDTIQLSASATGPNDVELTERRWEWTASSAAATVERASGILTTVAAGSFTVSATTGFVTGSSQAATEVLPREFTRIAAGGDFSCATITLDRVYCFGVDSSFQLGAVRPDTVCFDAFDTANGDVRCSLLPVRVRDDLSASTLTVGGAHACALVEGGEAYCWGNGAKGQLGNGMVSEREAPMLVTSAVRFMQISAGYMHTCALDGAGAAWCWGSDTLGQLGNRKTANSTTPIPVEDGHVFQGISAGVMHSCGVRADGRIYCWGSNEKGQVGSGSSSPYFDAPVAVSGGMTFSSVTAGRDFSCALTPAGAAYCWGEGSGGQLGRGSTEDSRVPVAVSGGHVFTSISAGHEHSCGLTTTGSVLCWGTVDLGILGSEPLGNTPRQVIGGNGFVQLTSGKRHSCGIRTNGTAFCWGSNVMGPFGDGLQALWRPDLQDPAVLP